MKIVNSRSVLNILFSALLIFSFLPTQALAMGSTAVQEQAAVNTINDEEDGVFGSISADSLNEEAVATKTHSLPDSGQADVSWSDSSWVNESQVTEPSVENGGGSAFSTLSSSVDAKSVATVPLANIIESDEAGNPHAQMYTTLLDVEGKVVDTNDPNRIVDKKYQQVSQGGEGAGLDRGASVTVHFRMASITPQNADGEGTGVQENTTYTMDLPWQLVAAKEDKEGNKLVDPDAPLKFFTSSETTAEGGVYSKFDDNGSPLVADAGDPLYELHVQFANVEKRVDILGEFQYTTTVSEHVTSGSMVALTYVPGGTVSFKVNEDVPSVADESYHARIEGASGGPTSHHVYTQLYKSTQDVSTDTAFAYKDIAVSLDNNMGVWVDEAAWAEENPKAGNVFNAYGDNTGPLFRLGVTYSEKDSSGNFKSESLVAKPSDIVESTAGKTIVRFAGSGFQVDVTFSKEDALSGSCIETNGKYSYIATKYTLSITDGNGGEVKDVRDVGLYVPTILASDYRGTSIDCSLALHAQGSSIADLDVTNSYKADLGQFNTPDGSTSSFNPQLGLEYVSASVCTWLASKSDSYRGNYYWIDFDPAVENDTGVNFYSSLASFLPGKVLKSDYTYIENGGGYVMNDGTASTFMSGGAGPGTYLAGMTSSDYWQFVGTVSVGQVLGDPNLVSNSCFNSGSKTDAKLQYQLKQVFAGADSSQQLVVYQSVDQYGNTVRNSYGDVMYIVVDPRTNANAQQQQNEGNDKWYNYREHANDNGFASSEGGSWRLHVFNAPGSSFYATFPQYQGTFDVSDQAKSGRHITDCVRVGNGSFDAGLGDGAKETSLSYGVDTYQASYMEAEWVGDDTVFWKMTMNADNWQDWPNGKLYVAADRSLEVVSAPVGAKVSGADVSGGYAFAKQSDGSWASVASGMDRATLREAEWNESCDFPTIEQNSRNNNYRISIDRNSFSRVSQNGKNVITVGFFTKVVGSSVQSDGSFTAKAQLVCHTGDPTLIAGSNHRSWPTNPGTVNYNGQWAYRVSATGYANTSALAKTSAETTSLGDSGNSATKWTLSVGNFNSCRHTNSPLLDTYYGGWNGRFTIGDSMRQSVVADASGNAVDVDAGKYTHVTRMFCSKYPSVNERLNGGGCGPIPSKGVDGDSWDKLVFDSDQASWRAMNSNDCYWDADKPGVYRKVLNTSPGGGTSNSTSNPMVVYVYYAGNMFDTVSGAVNRSTLEYAGANADDPVFSSDSLVIEYRGLEQVNSVGSSNQLDYQTELDTKAIVEAAAAAQGKSDVDALTSFYDVSLKNTAGFGSWIPAGNNAVSSSVEKEITAALAIKKSVNGPESIDDLNGGLYARYGIDVQVGYSPTEYVNFEDHISKIVDSGNALNGSESVEYDISNSEAVTDQSMEAIAALARASQLKNFKITVTEPGGNPQEIGAYDESLGVFTFADGWKSSTVTFGGYSEQPGSLFNGQIMREANDDGVAQPVDAQTKISFTYDLYLDIDKTSVVDGKSFRESDYYHGGTLTLFNHAQAERPYSTLAGSGENDVSELALQDEGGAVAVVTDPVLQGDSYAQIVNDGIALAGGEVGADGMLRTWPDADVQRTFLSDQLVSKAPVSISNDKQHIDWMFYDWTGTDGKNNPSVSLKDMADIFIDDYWADVDDMTSAQKLEKRQQLATLLSKHISVSDLKVYLVGKNEKPEISNGSTNLAGKTPLYSIDEILSSANDGAEPLTGGHTISFSYEQGGYSTNVDNQGTSNVYATGPGFTVLVDNLPFDSYLASTYSMDIDWQAFYHEAAELGILDATGNAVGTTKPFVIEIKNSVTGNNGQKANSSAGQVKVESATLRKSVSDVKRSDGVASWKLNAKTSSSIAPSELTFNDEPSFTTGSDVVAAAAKDSTSINDVVISLDGLVIYQNGALLEEAKNAGWTDNNVSVLIEGTKLSIVLKNTEDALVLDKNQNYEVTYKTVLDKDAFVFALVAAGVTMGDASYAIQNSATLSSGGAALSAVSDARFSPSAPISATKSAGSTPQDGTETQSASFTVTAGTGDISRKDFTLSDQLTRMTGFGTNAAAADKAMMLSVFKVKIAFTDGSEENLDAVKILNNEIKGVSLVKSGGESLELNAPGSFGVNRGWKLVFDELPANAMVSVDYTLTVDRQTYIEAGGDFDSAINFQNAFRVSVADGSSASVNSTGKVKVQPDVSKKGIVSSEKSAEGNPLINWTIDTRLSQIFGANELANLETASAKDVLDQRLKYVGVTVQGIKATVSGVQIVQLTEGSDYEVLFDTATNTLEVKIKNPSSCPDVRIVVKTEVVGSTDGIGNAFDVTVDGQLKGESKAEVKDNLVAVTQFGSVASVPVPTWQATAQKLVDSGQGATPAGKFVFNLVQVDENGVAIEGGQAVQGTNNANGDIIFDTVEYGPRNIAGTYWYQLAEKATDDVTADYKVDSSVKTVKVTIQKGADGNYLLSSEEVTSEGEQAGDVPTFNNVTRHDLNLAKTDLEGNALEGARFSLTPNENSSFADGTTDAIEVDAGTIQKTLLAGGVYTATEKEAPQGYQKLEGAITFRVLSDGSYEIVNAGEGWSLAQDGATVIAADAKLPSTVLKAAKLVDGKTPAVNLADKFLFTAMEVDESGNRVEGGYYSEAANAENGLISFDSINYEQVGTRYYRIAETAGSAGDDYVYDSTVYTVKVEVAQAADRSWSATQFIVAPEGTSEVLFNNATNPKPGNDEEKPKAEDSQLNIPSSSESLGSGGSAKTGDSLNVVVSLTLVILAALLVALIACRRCRKQ